MITWFMKRTVNLYKIGKNYSTHANTIYALSSGYGKCGVAIIRVSGPQCGNALKTLTKLKFLPVPRTALLRKIYNPTNNDVLDRGLILWFPAPNSFTGEDCCEFQVHGSNAVVSAVLKSLGTVKSLRPAEAGEFTRRAFLHGKLDLTEVEGLADLLQAETEFQRKQAYLQTEGVLSKLYNNWRSALMKTLANIEAFIDFEETESLDNSLLNDCAADVENIRQSVMRHLESGRKGEILRNGVRTVIIGQPNVGKSSLLNILCDKPKAIVSPVEGTTRDIIEVTIDINGYPIILMDTAGLRSYTADVIELEGMKRAVDTVKSADFVLIVVDVNETMSVSKEGGTLKFVQTHLANIQLELKDIIDKEYIVVFNKSDLVDDNCDCLCDVMDGSCCLISCRNNDGIDNLVAKITAKLEKICGNPSQEQPSMTQERHRKHLLSCANYLEQFDAKFRDGSIDVVLMAQDLRLAMRQIGKITGAVTTEDLLNVIFRDFCIGK